MFGEKKFDPESSALFSSKLLKTWLIHLCGHMIQEGYEICATIQGYYINCTSEMH